MSHHQYPAGEKNPGLRLQHVLGLQALAKLCCGSLEGAEVGSGEVVLHPRQIVARNISIKPQTPASTTLLLQTLLPAALTTSTRLIIDLQGGGTDATFAPTLDYFRTHPGGSSDSWGRTWI